MAQQSERQPIGGSGILSYDQDEVITTVDAETKILRIDNRASSKTHFDILNTHATNSLDYTIYGSNKYSKSRPADADTFWDETDDHWTPVVSTTALAGGPVRTEQEIAENWAWLIVTMNSTVGATPATAKIWALGSNV